MQLPPIHEYVMERPGDYKETKRKHLVPDPAHEVFWKAFYHFLASSKNFKSPLKNIKKRIDPYFSYFGHRCQPISGQVDYFHIGLDLGGEIKTQVFPVADGILEYAGYGVVNGNYVLLSHPDIVTEDGYMLYSIYMHFKSLKVQFSSYQKMLREISLHTYPKIPISQKTCIGLLGKSGIIADIHPYLHLQFEFRHPKKEDIILIDPARAMGIPCKENLTSKIKTKKEFYEFLDKNREEIWAKKFDLAWSDTKKKK